jgi:hypothetical protein
MLSIIFIINKLSLKSIILFSNNIKLTSFSLIFLTLYDLRILFKVFENASNSSTSKLLKQSKYSFMLLIIFPN